MRSCDSEHNQRYRTHRAEEISQKFPQDPTHFTSSTFYTTAFRRNAEHQRPRHYFAIEQTTPASLFTIYQTYKHGTNIVISWLSTFDQVVPGKKQPVAKETGSTANAERLSVKEILARAQLAFEQTRLPPMKVKDASKVTMVNRNKLTAHFESVTTSRTSESTIQSTERHKVFKDTLAKAYAILFPVSKKICRVLRQADQKSADSAAISSSNTFDILSNVIEQEPDYERSASEFWDRDVSAAPTQRSAITEDPIEPTIALHSYVLEMQGCISTVKTIWKAAAKNEVPFPVAAWTTNMAFQILHYLTRDRGEGAGWHLELIKHYVLGRCGNPTPATTAEELASANLTVLGTSEELLEFTHGYGLSWPHELLLVSSATPRVASWTMTMERKRLDQYFDTPSEERQAKHAFVDSITSLVNDSDKRCEQPDLEFQSKLTSVYLQRHQHDRELAKSMIYSLTRNPAYMTFNLKDWKWNSSNHPLAGGISRIHDRSRCCTI
jgi:hypothetical protein